MTTINISDSVARNLDLEVKKRKIKRSDLITFALTRLSGQSLPEKEKDQLYRILISRSGKLKLKAKGHLASGSTDIGRTLFLKAAALEIEAFTLLGSCKNDVVITKMTEILTLIAQGFNVETKFFL